MSQSKKLKFHEVMVLLIVVLQVLFFGLKMAGVIAWHWVVVALPVIIPIVAGVIALLVIIFRYREIFYEDEGYTK